MITIRVVDVDAQAMKAFGADGYRAIFRREPTQDVRFVATDGQGSQVTFAAGTCLTVEEVLAAFPHETPETHDPDDEEATASGHDQGRT